MALATRESQSPDALDPTDMSWRDDAACRDTDPQLFFPVGTTGPAIEQIARAKEVCGTCDSQGICLQFALETNQDTGVWGGTSEEERRQLRRAWVAQQKAEKAAMAATAAS